MSTDSFRVVLTALFALMAVSIPGFAGNKKTAASPARSESRISADDMEMDMKKGEAVLAGNVIITDDTMTLTCDNMTVHFAADQKISRVTATGHVMILEPLNKRKATAEKAEYNLDLGTIKLIGNPVLEMEDRKMYNAGTISYNLKSEKVKTTRIPGSDKRPIIEFKTGAGGGLSFGNLSSGGKEGKDAGAGEKGAGKKEKGEHE